MKKIVLICLLFWGYSGISYSGSIYDPLTESLYVGGSTYFYAQPHKGRDASLNKKIIKYNLKSQTKDQFFESAEMVMDVNLSPNGKLLAINMSGKVAVLNSQGVMIAEFEDVDAEYELFDFVEWSPDSRFIAYIARSTSLWVYDVNENRKEKISDKAVEMGFSLNDKKLHYGLKLDKPPMKYFIYDPATKTSQETSSYGIDFSPDGNYYISDITGDSDFALQRSVDNNRIAFLWEEEVGHLKSVYWLTNEKVFNFFIKDSFVFDPFKKEILYRFEGKVMGWSPDRKYIVSYKNKEAIITDSLTGTVIKRIKLLVTLVHIRGHWAPQLL